MFQGGGKLTVPACEVKKEKLEWEENKERERGEVSVRKATCCPIG